MTEDEIKAKVYAENKWQTDVMREASFDGYLAGLHEGQKENNKLLDVINNQDVKIADLEKENKEMKKVNNTLFNSTEKVGKRNNELVGQLKQAKKLLKNWQKEFNCKLSFNERAELVENTQNFLKE